MAYARGKVTEWDVLNEAFTNKDLQNVLGDSEMVSWFKQARAADPAASSTLTTTTSLKPAATICSTSTATRASSRPCSLRRSHRRHRPAIALRFQPHPPSRVLELIEQFAAFGKDLQVTEFDISVADEQVQAEYTRDFLTCVSAIPP
jgi:GH35 family endo-1,4-beta-xylanase